MAEIGSRAIAASLADIANELSSTREWESHVQHALELICEALPVSVAAIGVRFGGWKSFLCGAKEAEELDVVLAANYSYFSGTCLQPESSSTSLISGALRENAVVLPVTAADEVVGVLHVEFQESQPYSVDDVQAMGVVAALLGSYLQTVETAQAEAIALQEVEQSRDQLTRAYDALRASEERLQKAVNIETVGVLYLNLRGAVHGANAAFQRWSGYTNEELQSITHWEKLTTPEFLEASYREVRELATHGSAGPYEKQMIKKDGSPWWGIFAPTAVSGSGYDTEVVEFVVNITERKRAEETTTAAWRRAEALEGIAEAGIATRDLQELLDILVLRITEVLNVHSCSIWMLDDDAREFAAKAARGVPGIAGSRLRTDEGVAAVVYRERRPVCVADAENDPLVVDKLIKEHGIKSLITVPMISRDRVVGMVRVDEIRPRIFTDEEIGVIEAMASRAAQAIENIKLYDELTRSRNDLKEALDREQHFSLLLQRALLPAPPTLGSGYEVAAEYVPVYASRRIGGDFYDVFQVGECTAGVLIGDVAGKGLEAAAMAATTRSTIHAFVHEDSSPSRALERANAVLCSQQTEFGSFATVFLVIIDICTGRISYSSAGHPPPLICHRDGSIDTLDIGQAPLALIDQQHFVERHAQLSPGDKLVMYTDGISEARRDGEMLEISRIEDVLTENASLPASELVHTLLATATDWAGGRLQDDAAVVVTERSVSIDG